MHESICPAVGLSVATIFWCFLAGQQLDIDSQIQQHFLAAENAKRSDNLDTAAREYQAIIDLKPDFAEIHMNLGLGLHAQNKFDQSAIALGKSLKLKPGVFAAMLFQGINYCKLGRPTQAVPLLSKAAAEQPANKQARFWLASALSDSGRAVEAVIELEKASESLHSALKIRPDQAFTSLETADALGEYMPDSLRIRYQSALDEWSKPGAGSDPAVTLGLALAYARVGRAEEGRRQLQSMPSPS